MKTLVDILNGNVTGQDIMRAIIQHCEDKNIESTPELRAELLYKLESVCFNFADEQHILDWIDKPHNESSNYGHIFIRTGTFPGA